ncbi:hypothetical protein NKI91_22350, partial [Mesorhizobium sp. M0312]|uniref:hypothetical protein n=1 Tax=Mesorhizobium sp. M0312 TaxID=2956934 RepID=UPI003334B161
LPVGSMMDNTDIKVREAKSRAEGQHGRDQRSPTKGRLCCRHSVSRSNVEIVGLLPALATAEWSFNRLTRVMHRQLISPPGQKEGL